MPQHTYYAVPIVIVTRDSKLCVASAPRKMNMSHSKQTQRRPFVSKAIISCRSPGGLPQASRDSYLASYIHEFYFPRCGVRLDKGTGKRIVLVTLKIARAQEDWRSRICVRTFSRAVAAAAIKFLLSPLASGSRRIWLKAMAIRPSPPRPGLISKKDRPRSSFSQELSYPRNQKRQQQALAK